MTCKFVSLYLWGTFDTLPFPILLLYVCWYEARVVTSGINQKVGYELSVTFGENLSC